MANSITPSGTSRNVFDISLSDFETAGTITAGGFIGSGENLTKININNTEKTLEISKGGTGNYTYNNDGGLIYYNRTLSRFTNDSRLTWDINEKILKINNRDFLTDTNNYIKSTSNEVISILNTTSNILSQNISLNINKINNVSNYVLSTSNILIKYINAQVNNNSSNVAATKNSLGIVQIGDGIYVNKNGVISTTEEIINTTFPTFVNTMHRFTEVEGLNYKVCKLLYDPSIGTTFDRTNNQTNILPIWYIFSSNNFVYNSIPQKILNIGYNNNLLRNLELYGNVNIKPNINNINIEYTPVNTTYLEFDHIAVGFNNPTYCRFENDFNIDNIYKILNVITISFWLKINFNNNEITIIEFSNTPNNNDYVLRKLNINYVNNSLRFFISDDTNSIIEPNIIIPNIYKNRWYHIIWSIEKKFKSFELNVNINGILEKTLIISDVNYQYTYALGFINYNKNHLSSPNNNSIYRFCISDFKIYNYLLSNEQKTELYNTNNYTKYIIEFKDDETICDILAYGGGGGGSSNYGGGAGKLIYINDAYISSGRKTINIGRGGSGYYSNINNNQVALKGNDTTFEYLIADGGGAMTNTLDSNNNYSSISTNIIGGCGSGKNGGITNFNKTPDLLKFVGNTNNIYSYGYPGGDYGGGGIGYAGSGNNPGEGLYMLDNIVNLNTDTTKYFNYKRPINFKSDFGLNNNEIGELYNGNVYIGSGGYGLINDGAQINKGYNSSNSGCGGNLGENGKNGALLIRVLTKIDRNKLPQYIFDTSNYIRASSNNIIDYINRVTNPSAVIWNKNADNNINYQYNVGIGVEPPTNYKLEIAQANVITSVSVGSYGIHTSNNNNITLTDSINNNICAKFNSSIWATGNIIASSDERIKKNINDISDDSALQMILNIQPKTYNYIDTFSRGNNRIYGFIAQQIKEVIPDAVKIESEFVPNIFSVANYNIYGNIIILENNSINIENIIKTGSKVKCYDKNDNIIIIEVIKIIDPITFKIKDINYLHDKIFVYGSEVNDFHVLNKEYINTLNVCAVQELYRKIELQKNEINSLNEKINDIINFIDISK
jgi:hypothetical protein